MRIAYLTNHIGQTGVNQVIRDLVHVMTSNGHECRVFFLKNIERPVSFDCEVLHLDGVNELDGYDVIHTHGIWPELFVCRWRLHTMFQVSSLMLKKKRSVKSGKVHERPKLVTTLHCYCFQDFFDLYGRLKGFMLGVLYLATKLPFDKVVCLSQNMVNYYRGYISQQKLTYAYNTRIIDGHIPELSEEEQREIDNFKGHRTLIGMSCVLLYRKGIDVMLKAMTLLPEDYRLFIAGDGKERKTFEQMARELGISERVLFAGMKKDAYRYLPYYDIYALPSRSEGFPISLLEAAACGCKVVASRLPAVEECFTEEEIAKFDMPDEKALADAILRAEANAEFGGNLKKAFEEKYSPEVFYRKYLEIYSS